MAAGRPEHEYSETIAAKIHALLTFGIPKEKIANYIPLSVKTLNKHYADIIETVVENRHGAVEASLFYNCVVKNNVVAQMFYLRTQMPEKYGEKTVDDTKDLKEDIMKDLAERLPN